MREYEEAIVIVLKDGKVHEVRGTIPLDVYVADADARLSPTIEEVCDDEEMDAHFFSEVRDWPQAIDRHLEKWGMPQEEE